MSADYTAKDLVEIVDKALENYYKCVGGRQIDPPCESDGSPVSWSADDLQRKGFKEDFYLPEFLEHLCQDVDFTSAIQERLDYNF